MDAFELGRLTDFDFELVCKDLFQDLMQLQLEIFTKGSDQGVDLRHIGVSTGTTVIQCKHWFHSDAAKLTSHMRDSELPKIKRLAPDRYYLATSVALTKRRKDQLADILKPYVHGPGDIYGLDDIQAMLNSKPSLVRRHMRLWLTSASILESMLTKAIRLRSMALAHDLEQTLRVYAPNESYLRANDILKEQGVCIIAGLPGIGKTTLAQVLAAEHHASGFELVEISEDIEEANQIWDDLTPQFFYYDDFLGQTALEEKMHKNEDGRLISLLRRVNRSNNKRFVLTTREYVLAQARQRYERLAREDFAPLTCVLDLADYTRLIRAEILYNHIYFSQLPAEAKAQFAEPEVYQQVITHRNFNPRLIEQTLRMLPPSDDPREAVEKLRENLDNPRQIWEHVIRYQLESASVHLLIVLFSFRYVAQVSDLLDAWRAYQFVEKEAADPARFRDALKTLDGTLTRTAAPLDSPTVGFHNPSIRDFMREYITERPEALVRLLRAAVSLTQIDTLWTVAKDNQGRNVLNGLNHYKADLQDAIIRILAKLPDQEQEMDPAQAEVCLRIAEEFQLEGIWEYLEPLIIRDEFYEDVADGDDLVSFVRRMNQSADGRVRELVPTVVDRTVEWITEDLSGWNNVRYADGLLSDLGDLAPSYARSHVAERLDEEAQLALESWNEMGYMHSSKISEMEEIVDYAEMQEDREELFPGFHGVRDQVKAALDEIEAREVDTMSPSEEADDDDEDQVISRMFDSLRNP